MNEHDIQVRDEIAYELGMIERKQRIFTAPPRRH